MFEWDGSWLDIYVMDTSVEDWNRFLSFLHGGLTLNFLREGEKTDLPLEWTEELVEVGHLLELTIGKTIFSCVHFDLFEIELFIDPREFRSADDYEKLLDFMMQMGNAIGKTVFLGGESSRDRACLEVSVR